MVLLLLNDMFFSNLSKVTYSLAAKIKITQLPKKYTITIIYNGISLKNTVTVKQVLIASKITIKKKTFKKSKKIKKYKITFIR